MQLDVRFNLKTHRSLPLLLQSKMHLIGCTSIHSNMVFNWLHVKLRLVWSTWGTITHLCPPLRSTFAVRETASLGIMGEPRVPPLCRETQSLGQQMLNATVGINGLSVSSSGNREAPVHSNVERGTNVLSVPFSGYQIRGLYKFTNNQ